MAPPLPLVLGEAPFQLGYNSSLSSQIIPDETAIRQYLVVSHSLQVTRDVRIALTNRVDFIIVMTQLPWKLWL